MGLKSSVHLIIRINGLHELVCSFDGSGLHAPAANLALDDPFVAKFTAAEMAHLFAMLVIRKATPTQDCQRYNETEPEDHPCR